MAFRGACIHLFWRQRPPSGGKKLKAMVVERLDVALSSDRLQVILHRARYDFALERLGTAEAVLEIGTGVGAFTAELCRICRRFVGVEVDLQTCLEARRRTEGRAEILQADARALPFRDAEFSHVICLEVLEHLGDYKAGVLNLHRCLMASGMAIISVPYRKRGGKNRLNPYHLYEPGEAELVTLLKELFEVVEVWYQYFEETKYMTVARVLHIRRWVGLANLYRDLFNGETCALSRIRLGQNGKGMKFGLIVVAKRPKCLSPANQPKAN